MKAAEDYSAHLEQSDNQQQGQEPQIQISVELLPHLCVSDMTIAKRIFLILLLVLPYIKHVLASIDMKKITRTDFLHWAYINLSMTF